MFTGFSSCSAKMMAGFQSGSIVRQQAVVLNDRVLFDVLGIRFVENYSGSDHVFGGERSLLKRLERQTQQPHGDGFSWSFILIGDTVNNRVKVLDVGQRLVDSGVPDFCVYQMDDVEAKALAGFAGLNYPHD